MYWVVFVVFMMDIIYVVMFGYVVQMVLYEIWLLFFCDDNFWIVLNLDIVWQFDQNFWMYGVKIILFLDGLKCVFYGKEVKIYLFGWMIIMCGFFSVGWYFSYREIYFKWLDFINLLSEIQDGWKKIFFKVYDDWKYSFDVVQGMMGSFGVVIFVFQFFGVNGFIYSVVVLYYFVQLSLYVDIVDCQVYVGVRCFLGRKVLVWDYINVVVCMKYWVMLFIICYVVFYFFKFFYCVLVDLWRSSGSISSSDCDCIGFGGVYLFFIEVQFYFCCSEFDFYWLWVMYYVVLCIWLFVCVISKYDLVYDMSSYFILLFWLLKVLLVNYWRVLVYLLNVVNMNELMEVMVGMLVDGLLDLLEVLYLIFVEVYLELLYEVYDWLKICKEMLVFVGVFGL